MNTFLNYLLEANAALLAVLVIYYLLLKQETNFKFVRIALLIGITISVVAPLINIQTDRETLALPTLNKIIPGYWLPEFVVGNTQADAAPSIYAMDVWRWVAIVYVGGLIVSTVIFLLQLVNLIRFVPRKINIQHQDKIRIIELPQSKITFSFFHYVFIGDVNGLSETDKQSIIAHERTHAQQWHSLDMILVRLLNIIFWFNPLLNVYKKIFVQLHEFEADARAVENQDVNKYCSLLAKVALKSADFSIANHFNNSLTIKRIQMMRSIKSKIQWWKFTGLAVMLTALFLFIACQDQITGNEGKANSIPAEAEKQFTAFKQKYPGETFIVEYDGNENKKLGELDERFGKATHIELFTITHENKQRTFSMLQYGNQNSDSNEVFTEVEQIPEFEGGMAGLGAFLGGNLKYPTSAQENNIEGTTYVSFIVEKDGSVSDVKTQKGFDPACDAESERVVKLSKWIPGKQNGKNVRVKFVLPIKFKI